MKRLLLIIPIILFLTGCGVSQTEANDGECVGWYCNNIDKHRFENDKVTCYVYSSSYRGGISCLRDKE